VPPNFGIRNKARVLKKPTEIHEHTVHTIVTCHGLVCLDDEVVGDSMEKATLFSVGWTLKPGIVVYLYKCHLKGCKLGDIVLPSNGMGKKSFHIVRRFQFSSTLKRMSAIALAQNEPNTPYLVSVKGAPEVLRNMYSNLPKDYDDEYKYWARRGSRVLALGFKRIARKNLPSDQVCLYIFLQTLI
jgi:cation-transporting ATPase 13A1